jgi:hypothetical protein
LQIAKSIFFLSIAVSLFFANFNPQKQIMYNRISITILFATSLLMLISAFTIGVQAQNPAKIPVAGNTYFTSGKPGTPDRMGRSGIQTWESDETVYSIWFHVEKPSQLTLALQLEVPEGKSEIKVTSEGRSFRIRARASGEKIYKAGNISVKDAGYVRVDMQGVKRTGSVFAHPTALLVSSKDNTVNFAFVKDNESNRFYWGRRGPSVHLSYTMPPDKDIEWFYSEITVPEGEDRIGSYFMANGFAEGYFGMQVNSETERRVIFSVWSPFATDNPQDIPESDRIRVIRKGEKTIAHDFGNEGSGGHSRIIFPWKAGVTYGFLTRAQPDGNGNTIYSAWFYAPEEGEWQFITSFLRPKTDTWLKRLHSFLENFLDWNGYMGRMALHSNQWACDTDGNWHELTEARFTGDDIARRGYRLDYAGGAEDDRFFLRNGGFFHPNVEIGSVFKRLPGHTPPEIGGIQK